MMNLFDGYHHLQGDSGQGLQWLVNVFNYVGDAKIDGSKSPSAIMVTCLSSAGHNKLYVII